MSDPMNPPTIEVTPDGCPPAAVQDRGRWPLERALFAMAGTVTLLTAALAVLVSPWFLLMTGFTGVSQWLYVLFGACPASLVLTGLFGLRSTVYPARTPVRSAEAESAGDTAGAEGRY